MADQLCDSCGEYFPKEVQNILFIFRQLQILTELFILKTA